MQITIGKLLEKGGRLLKAGIIPKLGMGKG